MRRRGLIASLLLALTTAPAAADAVGGGEDRLIAIYWTAPGAPAPDPVAAAFAREVAARHGTLLPTTPDSPRAPIGPQLDAALAGYRAFRFPEAVRLFDEVARAVAASGGGELDPRQLADLHLHRGLARLELDQPEAWDDFVRAARLDPDRALDPSQFPPRAVTGWRRAVAETVALPRAELAVDLPPGAELRFDGRSVTSPIATTVGQHLLQITSPGAVPWAGEILVSGAHEKLEPQLVQRAPPTLDELTAIGRREDAVRVLLGGWLRDGAHPRFLGEIVDLRRGSAARVERAIDAAGSERTVEEVVRELAPLPIAVSIAVAPPPTPRPSLARRFAWLWGVLGGGATALAVALPLGLTLGRSTPDVGGPLGTIP